MLKKFIKKNSFWLMYYACPSKNSTNQFYEIRMKIVGFEIVGTPNVDIGCDFSKCFMSCRKCCGRCVGLHCVCPT